MDWSTVVIHTCSCSHRAGILANHGLGREAVTHALSWPTHSFHHSTPVSVSMGWEWGYQGLTCLHVWACMGTPPSRLCSRDPLHPTPPPMLLPFTIRPF